MQLRQKLYPGRYNPLLFTPDRPLPKEAPFHFRIKGEDMAVRPGEGLKDLVHAAARSREEAEKVLGAIERGRTWHEPSDLLSARDWLVQYTDNEDIIEIFRVIVANHHNIMLHELGAGEFIRYFRDPVALRTRGHAVGGVGTALVLERRGVHRVDAHALLRQQRVGDGELVVDLVVRVGVEHHLDRARRRGEQLDASVFCDVAGVHFSLLRRARPVATRG